MSDEMKPIAWLGPIEDWGRFRTARTDYHCRPAVLLEDYQALQQQLAAAREALAEMTADRDSWCDQASARVKDWHEAREALQAAKADAARYRWLKCGGWEVMQDPSMWPEYLKFDGAIDAARGVAVVLVPRKEGPALPLRGERARDKGETFGHIETDATLQRDRQL